MPNRAKTVSWRAPALLLLALAVPGTSCGRRPDLPGEQRVILESDGWEIVGDLTIPSSTTPSPAVLLLNQAAGNRDQYTPLARRLAELGLTSLRVDLRGHGESTNRGTFNPDEPGSTAILEETSHDVVTALRFLMDHSHVDSTRIGVVGASYSGEAMAEAGRRAGFARAYVALSPGSFSTESARGIDGSGAAWLFVRSREEPVSWVRIALDSVTEFSRAAEIWLVPGKEHAAGILTAQPGLVDQLAQWLAQRLES